MTTVEYAPMNLHNHTGWDHLRFYRFVLTNF